jgi:hypothetical protein
MLKTRQPVFSIAVRYGVTTMWKRSSLRLGFLTLIVAAVLPLASRAQSQDSANPSVAEAARRSRQLKKKSDKPVPVITEDTLKPAAPVSPNGPAAPADTSAPAPPESVATTDSAAPSAGPAAAVPAAQSDEALKILKKQLAQAQKELELSQLDLSLQQDTYFSNPDYIHDKAGKEKVDAIQQEVSEKQQSVDRLKTKLAALEELHNRSNPAAPTQP